ncbi:MAG: hypothetical protein IPG96_16125 [Proteobacteria bacterium]|nr:hypothetical protein [Pseudomonadota bacterium]
MLGAASKAFPKGDGTFLACLCRVSNGLAKNSCDDSTPTDSQAGTCKCNANSCSDCTLSGTSSGCGGTLSCACTGASEYCNQSLKRCCARASCSSGAADEVCGWKTDACGADQFCPCQSPGTCIVPAGLGGPRPVALGEQGQCCVFDRGAACTAASGIGRCRGTNPCDGSAVDCCPSGQVCLGDNTTCCQPRTCGTGLPGYTGTAGSPCVVDSRDDTCGGTFGPCNCIGNAVCSVGGRRAVAGETGTCCASASQCTGAGGPCQSTNTCTGEVSNCCGSGLFCNAGTSRCERAATCGDFTTGLPGQRCSTVADARFPRGDGSNLTCNCTTSGNRDNNTCVSGTCQCNARTCSPGGTFDCRLNAQTDRCAGTLSCGCESGKVCNPTNGQCCTALQCPAGGVARGGTQAAELRPGGDLLRLLELVRSLRRHHEEVRMHAGSVVRLFRRYEEDRRPDTGRLRRLHQLQRLIHCGNGRDGYAWFTRTRKPRAARRRSPRARRAGGPGALPAGHRCLW